jgi:hypothetical protein
MPKRDLLSEMPTPRQGHFTENCPKSVKVMDTLEFILCRALRSLDGTVRVESQPIAVVPFFCPSVPRCPQRTSLSVTRIVQLRS